MQPAGRAAAGTAHKAADESTPALAGRSPVPGVAAGMSPPGGEAHPALVPAAMLAAPAPARHAEGPGGQSSDRVPDPRPDEALPRRSRSAAGTPVRSPHDGDTTAPG